MDEVKDIPYNQFFSFQDEDNMIYGFDLLSIYNLFHKSFDQKTSNPYNRNVLAKNIKKNVSKILWLSRLFKEEIKVNMVEEAVEAAEPLETIISRSITIFHDMDILGNYTNVIWFTSLPQLSVVRFITDLNDIWSYRANLSDNIKREICPNHHDLFQMMYMIDLRVVPLPIVQDIALVIIERLVRSGINRDSRALGANFVLTALTLVNAEAAIALPWLFQSVL
jgi:hypothetical protein